MPFATKAIRDRARKRIAVRVRAGEPCALCGQPIDLTIAWPDPWSYTVDHVIPSSHGGDDHGDDQLHPAHKQCNERRGNQPPGTIGTNSGALG